MSILINAFPLVRTYVIIRILISVILRLKRSQWEKDCTFYNGGICQNYHNYRRSEVDSLISVRPPLQVGLMDILWHIIPAIFRHDLLIFMWHCETIFPFFFRRGWGGVDYNIRSRHISRTYLNTKKGSLSKIKTLW